MSKSESTLQQRDDIEDLLRLVRGRCCDLKDTYAASNSHFEHDKMEEYVAVLNILIRDISVHNL